MLGAAIERVYSLLKITREPVMTRFLASQLATTHTYSVSKAKDELGYIPKVSMDEGVDKLFSYLKRSD
jgi:nucleoside-diphosphate-sugar epimerase